jgi:phosphopantetheinyl transferase
MKSKAEGVCIYAFTRVEGHTTEQYIQRAVEEYLKSEQNRLLMPGNHAAELFAVARTEQGKPYFPNCREIGVSVSHSGKYVVCALAEGNIGVDIQERKPLAGESSEAYAKRLCVIAERFFHPAETDWVKEKPLTRFYEVFTAKESYVKYTGTGFDETLDQNCVLPQRGEKPSCAGTLNSVFWKSTIAEFWQMEYDSDYVLCLCAEHLPTPCVVRVW